MWILPFNALANNLRWVIQYKCCCYCPNINPLRWVTPHVVFFTTFFEARDTFDSMWTKQPGKSSKQLKSRVELVAPDSQITKWGGHICFLKHTTDTFLEREGRDFFFFFFFIVGHPPAQCNKGWTANSGGDEQKSDCWHSSARWLHGCAQQWHPAEMTQATVHVPCPRLAALLSP